VRVAVRILGLREERTGFGELLQDGEIGGRRLLRGEILDSFERRDANEVGGDFAVIEITAVVTDGAADIEFCIRGRRR